MKIKLTGMKSGTIPSLCDKKVIRDVEFEVTEEQGKALLMTGMYKKVREVKNVKNK